MVKVFQRKDKNGGKNGTYYFKVSVNGKQIYQSTGETNYNSAIKKATARVNELRGGGNYQEALKRLVDCLNTLPVEDRDSARSECMEKINEGTIFKMTLKEAFSAYKERPKKRAVSERTYRDYESLWNAFIKWTKKEYPEVKHLNEITVEVAEKYLASEWRKGISERTYNERIKKFRAMFSALSKKAGLFQNVWKSFDKMTELTISKKPLSPEQLKQLFEVADGEMRILFLIGIYTGLRLSDACLLKKSNIDFVKNTITVTPAKTRGHNKKVEIPLHSVLRHVLVCNENQSDYVLPEISRQYLKCSVLTSKHIQKTFEKAGIETLAEREGTKRKTAVYGFHSFRHSFVSLCASGGIPAHVVMEMVGHNSKAVHQIYQHATIEDKRKAIDLLPKVEG